MITLEKIGNILGIVLGILLIIISLLGIYRIIHDIDSNSPAKGLIFIFVLIILLGGFLIDQCILANKKLKGLK